MFASALSDRERSHGPEHPDTIAARGRLAHAYASARLAGRGGRACTSRWWRTPAGSSAPGTRSRWPPGPAWPTRTPRPAGHGQALAAYQMLSVDSERLLGPRHPDTLAARDNLAAAFLANGQTTEAIDRYKGLLADYETDAAGRIIPTRSRPGPTWPRPTAGASGTRTRSRSTGGCWRTGNGPPGPITRTRIAARANLAFAYRSAGQLREAIRAYERTLADRERLARTRPRGHPHRAPQPGRRLPAGRPARRGRARSTSARWPTASACSAQATWRR